MMVENVGNAQETTEMQWSSNTWSASTTIVDYSGNTEFGIELGPSETKQYLIEVEIPSSKQPGDSTSAILYFCIGSGIEEICEEFDVTIFASNTRTTSPKHSNPASTSGLIWDIETNYDGSTKRLGYIFSGMLKVGWNWSATGDLSINGTMLEMNGQNGQSILILPFDAPPRGISSTKPKQVQHTLICLSHYTFCKFSERQQKW